MIPENAFVELPHVRRTKPFRLDEPMHPLQIDHFRRATVGEKLQQLAQMRDVAIDLQKIGLRMRHPDWTPEQLETEARKRLMYGRT